MGVVVAGLLVVAGGRQFRISSEEDTAQGRMWLWVDGVRALAKSPLVGIGAGQYQEEFGLVAHNSFIHSNVELGIFGGTCFLGLFFLPLVALLRMRPHGDSKLDPNLWRLRPFVIGVVASYATGLCSISRCYVTSTYITYGISIAYLRIMRESAEAEPLPGGWKPLIWLFLGDLAILAATLFIVPRILTTGVGS